MAYLVINDVNIHYEKYGRKGKKIVLLHGWGQNTQMMEFIGEYLKKHFIIYNLDFPGFGLSKEPNNPWGVEDYAEFLRAFCLKNKIDKPILIGHSFGCRVALRYAHHYEVHKMVLTGAAGIRDKRTLMWYLKTYSYKLAKKIMPKEYVAKMQNKLGSTDYKNTSGVMRQTFVKVVNDDVTSILKDINVETLLVYGTNDKATPLQKGQLMEKLMPNATLITFAGDDHYAYINQAARFCAVLDAFLKEDY